MVAVLFLTGFIAFAIAQEQSPTPAMSPRDVHDVVLPITLLAQLEKAKDIRETLALSPDVSAVAYDTIRTSTDNADWMDNHPHVAVFRAGRLAADLDVTEFAIHLSGPIRFTDMNIVRSRSDNPILIAAFALAVDGSGTFFVFIGQQGNSYKVLATLHGAQAQLRFNHSAPDRVELWTADKSVGHSFEDSCVWCPKYYRKKVYAWRNGRLKLVSNSLDEEAHSPGDFDEHRFIIQ